MGTLRRVALLLDTSRGWDAGLLRGVARYAGLHNSWQLLRPAITSYQSFVGYRFGYQDASESLKALTRLGAEGVMLHESELSKKLRRKGVATVVIPVSPLKPKCGYVTCDDTGAGEAAARHLVELGLRKFGYVGFDGVQWSTQRGDAFRERLQSHGFTVDEHRVPLQTSDAEKPALHRSFAEWLAELPKPCGIFAGNDDLARAVIEKCPALEVRVPEHVAVVGADNDELICDLSSPPLSSIPFALEKAGYQAAEMLDLAMAGRPLGTNFVEAAAKPVVVRRSSNHIAVEDPAVAAALRYIRDHAGEPIRVGDVVSATRIPQRTLHQRFRSTLGHSIVKEINQRRAQHLGKMLTSTTLSLEEIAVKTGFPSDAHLVRFFRREQGETPGVYRRRLR